MTALGFRAFCYRCHKPQITCICERLTPVANRTAVWVLQHPRERLHPIGTARFASLGLANARVEVAWNPAQAESAPPPSLPPGAALLYPAPDARDLRAVSPLERPRSLVVIDGTWNTARTLYRDKAWLHALPQFRFLPAAPGRYRIRKEPREDYVSTIEAIVEALRILEPETEGFEALLRAFDAMIDDQLAYAGRNTGTRRVRKRLRPPAQRRIPHALVSDYERLLIVYAESARPGAASEGPRSSLNLPAAGDGRGLVYFAATAPASGRHFERVIWPESGLPDPEHLRHLGLAAADFDPAFGHAQFRRDWSEFLAASEQPQRLAAWSIRSLELLSAVTGGAPSNISIKSAHRALFGRGARGVEEVVEQLGLRAEPKGRAGSRGARRLAGAVAVARYLHERGSSDLIGQPG